MLTKEMKLFLADWLTWVNVGTPEHDVFEEGGLCANFVRWSKGLLGYDVISAGLDSMRSAFVAEGLDKSFPFDGHAGNYLDALMNASFTKNQLRVDWVRNHL